MLTHVPAGPRVDSASEGTPTPFPIGLQVEDLWKAFQPGLDILKGVSLRLTRGELVVVEGPTGVGKSTLLRLVAGVGAPDSGRVAVGGVVLTGASLAVTAKVRRTMGLFLAGMPLVDHLTVAENVGLALRAVGATSRERRVRTYEALKLFGLETRRADYPDQLSAGQLQCIGLARALAARPAVLLADEPTALVDRRTASQVLEVLRDVHSRGTTMLIASHDGDVAGVLGGRRLLLREGSLEELRPLRRTAG